VPTPTAAQKTFVAALEADNLWRGVGYTSEGLELSYEPDYGDVEVDQLLDSARIFKQSMRVSLNTTLVETTLENLIVAWGQSGGTLTSNASESTLTIAAGALGEDPVERSMAAVGPAPKADDNARKERLFHIRRALSVENTTIAMRRNEASMFPVSFRCLPDDNAAYGVIRDRKVPA